MQQQRLMPERRLSKSECLAVITEPLARDFGFRHLWIGYTGSGKTVANVELVEAAVDAHKYTIITDQKSRETPYAGFGVNELPTIGGFSAVPKDELGHKQAIVRGLRASGNVDDAIDFDSLAREVWTLSLENGGVLLAIDELSDATQGERSWIKGDPKKSWMRLLYAQGRENKVSIAACTQHVQEIPRNAISNSDTLGIFRQDRKEIPYYAASNFLDSRELDIVANLDPYEFLLVKRGMESTVCNF